MALDREDVTARVLDIAETLLNEGGAANLQARTIAAQAGVAVGSLYNLFGDLSDLHRAVNMRLLDRLEAAGRSAMTELARQGVSDTRQRLAALSRTYLDFVQAHQGSWAALLAFNRGRVHQPEPDAYLARLDALFEIISRVLVDGGYRLDERQRRTAARVLWSSVQGIVTSGHALRTDRDRDDETWEQINLLIAVFVAGLEQGAPFGHGGSHA